MVIPDLYAGIYLNTGKGKPSFSEAIAYPE